jgi:TRAP-type C4-dicarboxylate transport system permease small subunit
MGATAFFGSAGRGFRRGGDAILALLLGTIFVSFLAGIVFRYLLNLPMGWAQELSVVCWLWLVLWGAAFVVEERDEIRFDLIVGSVGRRTRIAMGIVGALSLVVLYAMALPATVSYVTFMKVEHTAYLKIRFDWLFSIYVIFAVAIIVRYLWILWRSIKGDDVLAPDVEHVSSGL